MIHKVFHHMNRTVVYPRSLDQVARILRCMRNRPGVCTRHTSLRVWCYSDFRLYGTIKDRSKYLSSVAVSQNYLPQIIPKSSYSSEERQTAESKKGDYQAKNLKSQSTCADTDHLDDEKNLSIFQRFKKMYRDYWYVLVPVHVITSLGWFGGFYYMAKSGVNIVAIVESLGVSDHIPDILKDSSAGYIAVAYALYKIATPFRYMVTIGGTTISIKYLKEYGYIKPIPPKAKLKEMYQERRENFKEKRQHFADEFKLKREQFKERSQSLMRERRREEK